MPKLPMAFFSMALCAASAAIFSGDAVACSMPAGHTIQKEFDASTLVFRGLVIETELSPFVYRNRSDIGRVFVNVRYEVKEQFKGKPKSDGVISTTNAIMGGCGVPVLAGQEYLFYVQPVAEDGRLEAPEFWAQTQGLISIYGTQALPADTPQLEEALSQVRAMASKQ